MNINSHLRVTPIRIRNVKVFLIQTQGGYFLIDTGIAFHERLIERNLLSMGVKLGDIQTIILTHGHLDHIGGLGYIKSQSDATVICHRSIKSALESGEYEEAIPRVLGWKLFNPLITPLLHTRLVPVHPDQVVDESLDLRELGLPGTVIHTPGHSPGSCSIFLDNRICFLGDLIRETSPGSYDTGLFYHDRDQILISLRKINSLRPKIIHLSHGSTMSGKELEDFIH